MMYRIGNKKCFKCPEAKITPVSDLDIVNFICEPNYNSVKCHYCEHFYDNIEKDEKQ